MLAEVPFSHRSARALWRKSSKNVRMVLLDIFWHSSCRFYCGPEASGIVPSSMLSSIVCRQSSRPVKAFITSSLGPSSSCKNQQEDFEEPQWGSWSIGCRSAIKNCTFRSRKCKKNRGIRTTCRHPSKKSRIDTVSLNSCVFDVFKLKNWESLAA